MQNFHSIQSFILDPSRIPDSPRTLKACKNIGIQLWQILYQKDSFINQFYNEYSKDRYSRDYKRKNYQALRQQKIQAVRAQRQFIIKSQNIYSQRTDYTLDYYSQIDPQEINRKIQQCNYRKQEIQALQKQKIIEKIQAKQLKAQAHAKHLNQMRFQSIHNANWNKVKHKQVHSRAKKIQQEKQNSAQKKIELKNERTEYNLMKKQIQLDNLNRYQSQTKRQKFQRNRKNKQQIIQQNNKKLLNKLSEDKQPQQKKQLEKMINRKIKEQQEKFLKCKERRLRLQNQRSMKIQQRKERKTNQQLLKLKTYFIDSKKNNQRIEKAKQKCQKNFIQKQQDLQYKIIQKQIQSQVRLNKIRQIKNKIANQNKRRHTSYQKCVVDNKKIVEKAIEDKIQQVQNNEMMKTVTFKALQNCRQQNLLLQKVRRSVKQQNMKDHKRRLQLAQQQKRQQQKKKQIQRQRSLQEMKYNMNRIHIKVRQDPFEINIDQQQIQRQLRKQSQKLKIAKVPVQSIEKGKQQKIDIVSHKQNLYRAMKIRLIKEEAQLQRDQQKKEQIRKKRLIETKIPAQAMRLANLFSMQRRTFNDKLQKLQQINAQALAKYRKQLGLPYCQ